MTAGGISIEVFVDDGGLSGALTRLGQLGAAPRPILQAAADVVEQSTQNRFDTSTGPGGVPWPQLRGRPPRNAEERRQVASGAQRRAGKPLVDSGQLRRSIRSTVDDRTAFIGPDGSTPSSRAAEVHQFGATILPKRGKFLVFTGADGGLVFARKVVIPARPFMGIDGQDVEDITDAAKAVVRQTLEG